MTYREYREQESEAFNALPIFYAFSNEQFKEAMEKRGLTIDDTDKIYRFGNGGFYLKKDSQIIKDFVNRPDTLSELMNDYNFAVSAFEYEMDNHEYAINYYQGDWDVLSCFIRCEYEDDKDYTDYLKEAGKEDWIKAYQEARKRHYKKAEEWF